MNLAETIYTSVLGRFYNYSIYSIFVFVKKLALVSKGKSVMDVGAGDCPYKKFFSESKYVSQDICVDPKTLKYDGIDIRSDIYNIPVGSESFDYILCTEVLEHLKYPERAFREFKRILKKGGELWLVTPLVWEEHMEPFDYLRYTKYFLEFLGNESGFEKVYIKPQGGRFIVFGKFLKDLIPLSIEDSFFHRFSIVVLFPIVFPILVLLHLLDVFDSKKNLTLQYECVFRKK